MRSNQDLLSSLYHRGVRLWTENGQLRFQAPKGALSSEDLNRLRVQRAAIIQLLEHAESVTDIPLRRRDAGSLVPLTTMQLRFWKSSHERRAGLTDRADSVAMRITGPLNADLLRLSIGALVQRHDILRTRIVVVDEIPTQQIDATYRFGCEIIDVAEMPRSDAEREVTRLGEEFVRENVDYSVGPLFATRLFKLSQREHVLFLASDVIVADAVSNIILATEIWTLYAQAVRGQALSLPKLPLQFADYAVWQERTYAAWLKTHAPYWKRRLSGATEIKVPRDVVGGHATHPVGAVMTVSFGNALSARLRDVARREATIPALVALSICVAALSHWCGRRDLILQVVSNGRHRPELQTMVGLLATLLCIRIELTDDDSFLTLLRRLGLEFRSAQEHLPFDRVPDIIPECRTELTFNWLPPGWTWANLDLRLQPVDGLQIEPFPLQVIRPYTFVSWFYDSDAGLSMTVGYRTDLISQSTMERFGRDMRRLAEELLQAPFARVVAIWAKLE